MTMQQPPIERLYDLSDLSEAGDEISVMASAGDLARLARWAGVDAVESFQGTVNLRRLSASRFSFDAKLSADILQSCVVTLGPVKSVIHREFKRVLHLMPNHHHGKGVEIAVPVDGEEEGPEEIESPRFDVAAPLLEEFLLAIDPYPRAPGVRFEPPPPEDRLADNPFRILKGLKMKD